MSYVGYRSGMEDLWDWVSHPYPEGDQEVSHMPKEESDCNSKMPISLTLVSSDDELFEDEQEPIGEEE